jgi:hypothetical protein
MKLCSVLIALALFASAAQAEQPPVKYDKFKDETTVSVKLDGFTIYQVYSGETPPPTSPFKDLYFNVGVNDGSGDAEVIFVGESAQTIKLVKMFNADIFPLGGNSYRLVQKLPFGFSEVNSHVLKLVAESPKVEYAVIGRNGRVESTVTDAQKQQIKALLDSTKYYSPEADLARKNEKERQERMAKAAEKARIEAAARARQVRIEAAARAKLEAMRAVEEEKKAAEEEEKVTEAKRLARRAFYGGDGGTVYILDATGSMINGFGTAKAETVRALQAIRPPDTFNIMFFQDDKTGVFREQLVPASSANIRSALRWLEDATTTGTGQSIGEAFRKALSQKPNQIVFFTETALPPKELDAAKRALAGSRVKVNVVAIDAGETTEGTTAKHLAVNGGECRILKETDLFGNKE